MVITNRQSAAAHRQLSVRRLLLPVLFAAVTLTLALPASAGAHVDPKYRSEYTRTLDSYKRQFQRWSSGYVQLEGIVTDMSTQMRPLIGSTDPEDQADLQALEHQAAIGHTNQERLIEGWAKTLKASFASFKQKGLRWFDAKRERARFVKQADFLYNWCQILLTVGAYPGLSQAELLLSSGAVDLADKRVLEARDSAHTAETDFYDTWLTLRKML